MSEGNEDIIRLHRNVYLCIDLLTTAALINKLEIAHCPSVGTWLK